ncbi:MAG: insulinase family protein [Gemmatimonadetes bacterium]|nr:insulinase family protein [Gemmatimonadota bacterium]MYB62436.1 insulinase family protein [Gemmatimonadota bacterium]
MSQDLAAFEQNVTEFTLDNGLTFIVVENHDAPVLSVLTYADVGSSDEVKGITGIAHLFEHMAFKGTTTIGAMDLEAEYAAMEKVDEIFDDLRNERHKGHLADPERLASLEQAFENAKTAARELGRSNAMDEAIDRAGGTGLNASTSRDATRYYYSLPSNKLELFFALESNRFLEPVLREFFIERDVVKEERRMSESSPVGRLVEEMLSAAYKAHPYGEPIVGHMSDIDSMTRAEAMDFFRRYYGAGNLTIIISGDADPAHVKELAHEYFDRLPAGPPVEPVETTEPPQIAERRVTMEDRSQPVILMGYHKVDINHEDDVVFNVLSDILGSGRTSRLYTKLVKDQKIAVNASSFTDFPGSKYPNMIVFFAFPSKDYTAADTEQAIEEEIERIRNEEVTEEELSRAKVRARVNLIRGLESNMGLATQLAYFHVLTGDWRNLFHSIDAINEVTAEDIKRVANQYLVSKNRTVALIVTMDDSGTE